MTSAFYNTLVDEWNSCPWEKLTKLEIKHEYYRYEPFFRDSWHDFACTLREQVVDILYQHTAICFLPDAIAGRRIESALDFLEGEGFDVVSFHNINYDWQSYNAEWRFQLNDTTLDRLVLSHDLCNIGPSALFLLRDNSPVSGLPATVRLRRMKGASNPELRTGENLRNRLNCTNRLLNFIHIPDEPIDLIRMLGVTMESKERVAILDRLKKENSNLVEIPRNDICTFLASHYENIDFNPLDTKQSAEDLLYTLQAYYPKSKSEKSACLAALQSLEAALQGGALNFLQFRELLTQIDIALESWMTIC